MEKDVQHWVKTFGMEAHPEGGYFVETYRSEEVIDQAALPDRFTGNRNAGTAIYFLMPAGKLSRLHRILSDELWHFYQGCPLAIHVIHPGGKLEVLRIGPDGPFQALVPHGCWFGAKPEGDSFSLVGCTVSPGFDFRDFELADCDQLLAEFPQHADLIRELT